MSTAEALKDRDFRIVVDRSGSMAQKDMQGGQSRWKAAEETTFALASKAQELDPDGITVYAFNSSFQKWDNQTADKISDLFKSVEPNGGTTLVPVLNDIFSNYKKAKAAGQTKPNGELVVVITDGEPTDRNEVARAIIEFTKSLESRAEFGLLFVQAGHDSQATSFLKKLDDDLEKNGAKFDIVDTITIEEAANKSLTDVILGALND
jgi:Mg-chelatase subunit ChlD